MEDSTAHQRDAKLRTMSEELAKMMHVSVQSELKHIAGTLHALEGSVNGISDEVQCLLSEGVDLREAMIGIARDKRALHAVEAQAAGTMQQVELFGGMFGVLEQQMAQLHRDALGIGHTVVGQNDALRTAEVQLEQTAAELARTGDVLAAAEPAFSAASQAELDVVTLREAMLLMREKHADERAEAAAEQEKREKVHKEEVDKVSTIRRHLESDNRALATRAAGLKRSLQAPSRRKAARRIRAAQPDRTLSTPACHHAHLQAAQSLEIALSSELEKWRSGELMLTRRTLRSADNPAMEAARKVRPPEPCRALVRPSHPAHPPHNTDCRLPRIRTRGRFPLPRRPACARGSILRVHLLSSPPALR